MTMMTTMTVMTMMTAVTKKIEDHDGDSDDYGRLYYSADYGNPTPTPTQTLIRARIIRRPTQRQAVKRGAAECKGFGLTLNGAAASDSSDH